MPGRTGGSNFTKTAVVESSSSARTEQDMRERTGSCRSVSVHFGTTAGRSENINASCQTITNNENRLLHEQIGHAEKELANTSHKEITKLQELLAQVKGELEGTQNPQGKG
jgi:hypothetical protein